MKKTYISLILFILFGFVFNNIALSWDNKTTHMQLSKYAAENSVMDKNKGDYLKKLGFEGGLTEEFKINGVKKIVSDWIAEGANLEDAGNALNMLVNYGRSTNHFHNPLKPWSEAGLNDVLSGKSSLLWAQDGAYQQGRIEGDWSWRKVREYYHLALTSIADLERQTNFAKTFRGLGHQVHLLQDKAVPYHVRNDAHPLDSALEKNRQFGARYFETWAKETFPKLGDLKAFAPNPIVPMVSLNASYDGLVPITQFTDTKQYNGTNPSTSFAIGLAEYTNANFFSDETLFAAEMYSPDHKHYFPYPKQSSTNLADYLNQNALPEVIYAEDGVQDLGFWIQKTGDGETITHFVKPRYWTTETYEVDPSGSGFYKKTFYLDEKCHEDYAKLLLPRAVGYSAGLLNYFFRGTLDVIMPDRIVYAIADGSAVPQQFTTIKAKVQNTTPNEAMGAGTLVAFAKYKKRIGYQPDLSADPPTAESREADFSYSVSAPITITSLPTLTEFTFDFAQSPIPAGITDLYLFVVFKGTLGSETDTAVAVGMEDLYEPLHITVWNSTDRFYLDHVLRTREDILSDPLLLSRVDHDGDGSPDERINRYSVTTDLAFAIGPVWAEPYQVSYYSMPPGGYGRLLLLADTEFWIHARRETSDIVAHSLYMVYDGVVNAEYGGAFYSEPVYSFRGILQHGWISYAEYYPDNTDIWLAPWPTASGTTPSPVGFIRQ